MGTPMARTAITIELGSLSADFGITPKGEALVAWQSRFRGVLSQYTCAGDRSFFSQKRPGDMNGCGRPALGATTQPATRKVYFPTN